MKVLSLFDGISCGMVALERVGIPVERYVAYEYDEITANNPLYKPYGMAAFVASNNFPMIEQKGNVFEGDFTQYIGFDLLIGGSPCTYWSIARCPHTEHKRETTSSGLGFDLFMQFVRALKEAKPKWFLYENNASMSVEIKNEITKQLGVEPLLIDSADFSAQTRKRLYWTNIPVELLSASSTLVFSDIEYKTNHKIHSFEKYAETIKDNGINVKWDSSGKGNYSQQNRARRVQFKMNTLPSSGNDKNNVYLGGYHYRKIHPIEAERLQTLPDNYTECIPSAVKRVELCGNGWTVDVIAYIFTYLKTYNRKEKNQMSTMELKVKEFTFPEVIEFNYEEIEAALQEKMAKYESHVYTEGQMTEAKKDLADLRKFAKAMSDERIRIKKEYMKPCDEFEAKIKKLDAIVQKPIEQINNQVKFYEEETKSKKKLEISCFFEGYSPFEWLKFDQIFNEKWLNATVKIPAIQKEIEEIIHTIEYSLQTLADLPEFSFEATEVYKDTLDINKAISEGKRLSDMQKRKAEAEAKACEEVGITPEELHEAKKEYIEAASANGVPVPHPVVDDVNKQWISFKALLSMEDALALKKFFDDRNIIFEKI